MGKLNRLWKTSVPRRALGYVTWQAALVFSAVVFGVGQSGFPNRIFTSSVLVPAVAFVLASVPLWIVFISVYEIESPKRLDGHDTAVGELFRNYQFLVKSIFAGFYLLLVAALVIIHIRYGMLTARVMLYLIILCFLPMASYAYWLYRHSGYLWRDPKDLLYKNLHGVFKVRHQFITPVLITVSIGTLTGLATARSDAGFSNVFWPLMAIEVMYALLLFLFRERGARGRWWQAYYFCLVCLGLGVVMIAAIRQELSILVICLFLGLLVCAVESLRYVTTRPMEIFKRKNFELAPVTTYENYYSRTLDVLTTVLLVIAFMYLYPIFNLAGFVVVGAISLATWALWVVLASTDQGAINNRQVLRRARIGLLAGVPFILLANQIVQFPPLAALNSVLQNLNQPVGSTAITVAVVYFTGFMLYYVSAGGWPSRMGSEIASAVWRACSLSAALIFAFLMFSGFDRTTLVGRGNALLRYYSLITMSPLFFVSRSIGSATSLVQGSAMSLDHLPSHSLDYGAGYFFLHDWSIETGAPSIDLSSGNPAPSLRLVPHEEPTNSFVLLRAAQKSVDSLIECDVMLEPGALINICFRLQASGAGYMARLDTRGGSDDDSFLEKFDRNGWTHRKHSNKKTLPGEWVHVCLEVRGALFLLRKNNEVIADWSDESYAAGQIGVFNELGEVHVDNFLVTPLDPEIKT